MKYYYDTKNMRFTMENKQYRLHLDGRGCFMGTDSFGIYFTHHVQMPVSPMFFVPSSCGLKEDIIKEFGITSVYIGEVSHRPNFRKVGYGKEWSFAEIFHGLHDSNGCRLFGLNLSRFDLHIGHFRANVKQGLGFTIELGDGNSKTLEYGLFENGRLCTGKCYKRDDHSIRWFIRQNFKIDGVLCDLNSSRLYKCAFSQGKREGDLMIHNRRFEIHALYHENKLNGRFNVNCKNWTKHLFYNKGICTHGKIVFPNNMKFTLNVENGSEIISMIQYQAQSYSDPMDLIENVPHAYLCPISLQCMNHPVSSSSLRFFYDRRSLQNWLEKRQTEPMTNMKLSSKKVFFNFNLQDQIYVFLKDYFTSLSERQSG